MTSVVYRCAKEGILSQFTCEVYRRSSSHVLYKRVFGEISGIHIRKILRKTSVSKSLFLIKLQALSNSCNLVESLKKNLEHKGFPVKMRNLSKQIF